MSGNAFKITHAILALIFLSFFATGCGDNNDETASNLTNTSQSTSDHGLAVFTPSVAGPITGGLRGGPWDWTVEGLTPLDEHDFIQEEFFFSGTARGTDNMGVPDGTQADYTTRMLVVRPRLAENFNGTVLVEWVNTTVQAEVTPVWTFTKEAVLRDGYAHVAISVQQGGVDISPLSLKLWDPLRYAPLTHPGDIYEFDIFAQGARALVAQNDGPAPLGTLEPERIIASGVSQSAALLLSYANNRHREDHMFDGFLIGLWTREIADDIGVPTLLVLSETEMEGFTSPLDQSVILHEFADSLGALPGLGLLRTPGRQFPGPDTVMLRVWEIAGGTHVDQQELAYLTAALADTETQPLGLPTLYFEAPIACILPPNRLVKGRPFKAALKQLDQWLITGKPPPSMPRLEQHPDLTLARDEDGLAVGGIRMPDVEAPIGINEGKNCSLLGSYTAFTSGEIRERYPSKENYLEAVSDAVVRNVEVGTLLPEDAEEYLREADAVNVWGG